MKKMKFLATALFATVLFASCSSDDDAPVEVNEEEVITTMTVTLNPTTQGTPVILRTQDLDGDGPNPPIVTVSGNLAANASYSGQIVLLNETEDPAENITLEVIEEAEEHQFFYTTSAGLNVTTAYLDFDVDGNPLGTEFTLTTGEASSGTITFTLRHEPTKPNSGLSDAGGETDVTATFEVTVE
ncbi:type 1 periplasmic binding fold superfamily protein [Aequorivita echinoideorum]|uniref:Type 1 periplasmic binding fold superfamily protein n=1 Tax=Aequorivita echinoideorum TaxID=1549647 RepID=A0ABS5S580_9FLAO|nr:type 1 periplasmic binding fold superfamily protein [Aequorivita echinoideorum]MBT0608371.1 type 1 periplasmic binding fold superfamily protein [Aequorivita echinoideorum]